MAIDFLLATCERFREREALHWQGRRCTYGELLSEVERWRPRLADGRVRPGTVVSLEADFSPTSVAILLLLLERAAIIVPLTASVEAKRERFLETAEVEVRVAIDERDAGSVEPTGRSSRHRLLRDLRQRGHPGLVLFSSGTTGDSKAALHDLIPMLEKYRQPRHAWRTLTFLLFDHIGGFNTLLYTLANGGCVVTVGERDPDTVCRAIEGSRVELLPTSPTFLNLMLVSEAYRRHDLSSLRLVTYGTEPMPEATLDRFHRLFPEVQLQQTYGLSEVGILRSKSESSGSLWVRLGGEGFETRVVDGVLEVKAKSAMLGYLNAPSPFTDDGWLRTGDLVEVRGEYLRILGRDSDIINVGGEKVYPAEVEGVLQLLDGVEEVVVAGEPSPLTGQLVKARVKLRTPEPLPDFRRRMRAHCRGRLARYQIPQKVEVVTASMHGERFKKVRR